MYVFRTRFCCHGGHKQVEYDVMRETSGRTPSCLLVFPGLIYWGEPSVSSVIFDPEKQLHILYKRQTSRYKARSVKGQSASAVHPAA